MAGQGVYSSSIDFRLPKAPPAVANLEDASSAITSIFSTLNIMAQAFTNILGVGHQETATWPQLSGSDATLGNSSSNKFYAKTMDDLTFGELISLVDNAGIAGIMAANAASHPCHGFCSTEGGATAGSTCEVTLLEGLAPVATGGLTIGHRYFLAVGGGFSPAPAVGAGQIEQFLGIAVTTSSVILNVSNWIQH